MDVVKLVKVVCISKTVTITKQFHYFSTVFSGKERNRRFIGAVLLVRTFCFLICSPVSGKFLDENYT